MRPQHWSEIDRRTPGLPETAVALPFTDERLHWYRDRLEAATDVLERTFPTSQIVWRRPHEPGCGRFDTPCARVVQYGQVADHVMARRPRVRINQLVRLLRGQSPLFTDEIHPGVRFALVASDVTLFELKRAVTGG